MLKPILIHAFVVFSCSNAMQEDQSVQTVSIPISKVDKLISFCYAHMNGLLKRDDDKLVFPHYLNGQLKHSMQVKLSFEKAHEYWDQADDIADSNQFSQFANNAVQTTIINKYACFKNNADLPDSMQKLKTLIADFAELANAFKLNNQDKYNFDSLTKSERLYLVDDCSIEQKRLEDLQNILVANYINEENGNRTLRLLICDLQRTRKQIANSFETHNTDHFDKFCNQLISLEQMIKKFKKQEQKRIRIIFKRDKTK